MNTRHIFTQWDILYSLFVFYIIIIVIIRLFEPSFPFVSFEYVVVYIHRGRFGRTNSCDNSFVIVTKVITYLLHLAMNIHFKIIIFKYDVIFIHFCLFCESILIIFFSFFGPQTFQNTIWKYSICWCHFFFESLLF